MSKAKPAGKGVPDDGDLNEILRFNAKKAAAALGTTLSPALSTVLNGGDDPSAPLEEMFVPSSLGPAQMRLLCSALLARGAGMKVPAYKHLKRLKLLHAEIGDEGAEAGAEVLRDGCAESLCVRLEAVELVDCGVGPRGASALGQALMLGANASLSSLNLDLNQGLGDSGVGALCRGLESNRLLKQLSLRYCGLGPGAAQSLTSVLRSPLTSLEILDLSGNHLGSPGLQTLALAARGSRSLQELRLSDNGIGGGSSLPELYATSAVGGSARSSGSSSHNDASASVGSAAAAAADSSTVNGKPQAPGASISSDSSDDSTTATATSSVSAVAAALACLGEALQDTSCPLSR